MSRIGPARLDERQSTGEVFVLDIRPEEEYRRNHIEGSYNAPVYHDLQQGSDAALEAHLDEFPEDVDVVTVCKAGVLARRATEYLDSEGYDATTLIGGYTGWRQYEKRSIPYRVAALLRKFAP